MWDNPRLLNVLAGFLTGVAVLLFAFAALQALLRSALLPLREVTIHGSLANLSRPELENAARARLGGNFLSVRLPAVRAAFESLAWVRRAQVRRVWPDRLEVALEEHRALAHWRDDGLVNTFGERFPGHLSARLPVFAGPAGSERIVTERYRRFLQILSPLETEVSQVVLTPRYAWQLKLANGLEIVLGRDASRDPAEARLARFVQAYPSTLARIRRNHEQVDLRYPNGFALRLPGVDRQARRNPADG